MIYILTALKAEAQAFVDKYKLKQYKNEDIEVIITGIGVDAMSKKTSQTLKKLSKNDTIINVGICGANKNYNIGELIDARYTDITCIDYEMTKDIYDVVDMESAGFLEATKGFKNSFVFKVVSDHFEPKTVSKDMAKKLIFNQIDEIIKRVKNG
ncbi:MAG: hypothetical protein ABGW74_02210 [Campylobacterales bacterium]